MRAGLVVAVIVALTTTAVAEHRNAGTYSLTRRRPTQWVTVNGDEVARCDPAEPTPTELVLLYRGPDVTTIVVNGDEWLNSGLTTDPKGRPSRYPLRVARQPPPPSSAAPRHTSAEVWFRRDGTTTTGNHIVFRFDPKTGDVVCVTAHELTGTFAP